jgi:isopenicillin N synthase-like dioxygenase
MFQSKSLEEMRKKRFIEIDFPLERAEIELAMNSFLKFLETVSQEEKERVSLLVPFHDFEGNEVNYGDDKGAYYGYMKKAQEKGDLDSKEYFHYNPYLEELVKNLNLSQEYLDFLDYGKKIFELSCQVLKKELRVMEEELPGITELLFPKNSIPKHALRFLLYKTAQAGSFIAKGHYDKGFFTIAIAESAPGLRLGLDAKSLQDIEHKEKKGLFFPALNLKEMNGELKACWHEVLQKESDAIGKECSRWALVFFVNPNHIQEEVTHKDTHTSY